MNGNCRVDHDSYTREKKTRPDDSRILRLTKSAWNTHYCRPVSMQVQLCLFPSLNPRTNTAKHSGIFILGACREEDIPFQSSIDAIKKEIKKSDVTTQTREQPRNNQNKHTPGHNICTCVRTSYTIQLRLTNITQQEGTKSVGQQETKQWRQGTFATK